VSSDDLRAFTESQLNLFGNLIMRMDRQVKDLIADTQQGAVKFNSFGFYRVEEANSWVEVNLPEHKFGLIDDHMVFKQLHSSTAKTILTLQQLANIEMKDLSQGVAGSLFDQQLPKILSDVTGYVVVQKEESYFNQVKTHKEWEEPQTGFRDRLKIDLETLELAHIQLVADNTQPSSALQAAASLLRTYALAWIGTFINFIDDTYAELTRAKFSAERGWSLITRLGARILIEVAGPWNGVKHNFITGRNDGLKFRRNM
jgi:hypothetical protein